MVVSEPMVCFGAGLSPGKDGRFLRADDPTRHADDHGPGRNDRARDDDSVRADDAFIADLSVVKNGRVHPDDAVVADRGIVDDGRMPDGDVLADLANMDDRVVLDIASFADDHWSFITAQHGQWPDARSLCYPNVPDDDGRGIDVDVLSHGI
jgi:hypothetical protein